MARRTTSRSLSRQYEPTFLELLCLRTDDTIYDYDEEVYDEEEEHSYVPDYNNSGILSSCLSGFVSSSDSEDDYDNESSFSRIARRRRQARAMEKRREERLIQQKLHSSVTQLSKDSSKLMKYNKYNYHSNQVLTDEDNDYILNLQLPMRPIQQATDVVDEEKIILAAYADDCSSEDEDDRYKPLKTSPSMLLNEEERKEEGKEEDSCKSEYLVTRTKTTDSDSGKQQGQMDTSKESEVTTQTEKASSQENIFSSKDKDNDNDNVTDSTALITSGDKNKGEEDDINEDVKVNNEMKESCETKYDLNHTKRIDLENVSDEGSVLSYEKRMADIMEVKQKRLDNKVNIGDVYVQNENKNFKKNTEKVDLEGNSAPHGDINYDPVKEYRSNNSDDEDGSSINTDILNEIFQKRYKIDAVRVDINPLGNDPISTIRSEDSENDKQILKPDKNQEHELKDKINRSNQFASLLNEMKLARMGVEEALASYDTTPTKIQPLREKKEEKKKLSTNEYDEKKKKTQHHHPISHIVLKHA